MIKVINTNTLFSEGNNMRPFTN